MEYPDLRAPATEQLTGQAVQRRWAWAATAVTACLLASALALGLYRGFWPGPMADEVQIGAGPRRPSAGRRNPCPSTVPAASAVIAEDERVIGVAIGGHHRAYCLTALSGNPVLHVVDDRIGQSPVCVTYCPLGQCAAHVCRPNGTAPGSCPRWPGAGSPAPVTARWQEPVRSGNAPSARTLRTTLSLQSLPVSRHHLEKVAGSPPRHGRLPGSNVTTFRQSLCSGTLRRGPGSRPRLWLAGPSGRLYTRVGVPVTTGVRNTGRRAAARANAS